MRTNVLQTKWLIPLLALALLGAGYPLLDAYLGYTKQIGSGEKFSQSLAGLQQTLDLNQSLEHTEKAGPVAAKRSLNDQLSGNLKTINARLASADADEKAFTEIALAYLARHQPGHALAAGGSLAYHNTREATGQKIPISTLASANPGK